LCCIDAEQLQGVLEHRGMGLPEADIERGDRPPSRPPGPVKETPSALAWSTSRWASSASSNGGCFESVTDPASGEPQPTISDQAVTPFDPQSRHDVAERSYDKGRFERTRKGADLGKLAARATA
jgi:hypothetical protein